VLLTCYSTDLASAQISGNPAYPALSRGLATLHSDFGAGVNDGSGKANYLGGRIVMGLSKVSLWASAGGLDRRIADPSVDDKQMVLGGGVALHLTTARESDVGLSLNAGVGTVSCSSGCRYVDVVAGPAASASFQTGILRIEPWAMPRIHVSRMTFRGASVLRTGIGGSAGIDFDLTAGLGLQAAVDFASFPAEVSGGITATESSPLHLGVGLSYTVAR